eukprot:scaffold1811_cov145-Skeletonema_menzelii.AAC.8
MMSSVFQHWRPMRRPVLPMQTKHLPSARNSLLHQRPTHTIALTSRPAASVQKCQCKKHVKLPSVVDQSPGMTEVSAD